MKKRFLSITVVVAIVLSTMVFPAYAQGKVDLDSYDYEKKLEESYMEILEAEKMDVTFSYDISETVASDINMLIKDFAGVFADESVAIDESILIPKDKVEVLNSVFGNMAMNVNLKVDVTSPENAKFEMNPIFRYKDSDVVNGKMYIDNEKIYFNENKLLNQGVYVDTDFILEMVTQSGEVSKEEINEYIKMVFEYTKNNKEESIKFNKMISAVVKKHMDEPTLSNEKIKINGVEEDVVLVEYTISYADALKIAKDIINDDEILNVYKEILVSQYEINNGLTGGYQTAEEYAAEMESMVKSYRPEINTSFNDIMSNKEMMNFLEDQNFILDYYLNDGLVAYELDLNFVTIKSEYNAIGDEVKFSDISKEDSYVVENQFQLMGIESIVNEEEVSNLGTSDFVLDLIKLEEVFEEPDSELVPEENK